jgi:hypothetical protein
MCPLRKRFGFRTADIGPLGFAEGELVEVKTAEEICQTLDRNFEYEGLPFMDEMRQYCGKELRVLKRVGKMIVEGVGIRYIKDTVILEGAECNGESHEKCKKTCPIFWKEAWLKRPHTQSVSDSIHYKSTKTISDHRYDSVSGPRCQSAGLVNASSELTIWDLRRYTNDVKKGRIRPLLLSLNLLVQKLLTGKNRVGLSTKNRRTPSVSLDLQPG